MHNINTTIERQTIASLFAVNEASGNSERVSKVFATLTADDFTDDTCSKMFAVMKKIHDSGNVVTENSVFSELSMFKDFSTPAGISRYNEVLDSLGDGAPELHIMRSAKALRELTRRRKFVKACHRVKENLERGEPLSDTLKTNIAPILDEESGFGSEIGATVPAQRVASEFESVLIANCNGNTTRPVIVPTGFGFLDSALGGGFKPGQLVIIGARPSVGKTTLALNFMLNALDSNKTCGNVLFITLEMTARELIEKIVSRDTHLPVPKSEEQIRATSQKNRNVLAAAAKNRTSAPILFVESVSDINQLCTVARKADAKSPLFALFVDYLQLIPSANKFVRRYEAVSEISMRLKSLAKELEVPVIALAQLNRNSADEDRPPRPSDLKESGQIEQDADVIILLSRAKDQEADEAEISRSRKILVDLAKNRSGYVGSFYAAFDGATSRFSVWI